MMTETPDVYIPEETRLLEELDRNARAYGWEVGRGHPLTEKLTVTSPDNPFMDRNWRDKVEKSPEGDNAEVS
jgi:hypothetical protein